MKINVENRINHEIRDKLSDFEFDSSCLSKFFYDTSSVNIKPVG